MAFTKIVPAVIAARPRGRTGEPGPPGAPGDQMSFDTRAIAQATSIDPAVNHLRVAGLNALGDCPDMTFTRKSSAQPFGFQSADGAFWGRIKGSIVDVRQFSVVMYPDEASALASADQSAAFAFADGDEIYIPEGYVRLATDAALYRVPVTTQRRTRAPKWRGAGCYKTFVICDAVNSAVLGTRLSQAAHDAGGFYFCWSGWIEDITFIRGTAADASAIEIIATDTFNINVTIETNGADVGLTGHGIMFPFSLGGVLPPGAPTADSIQSMSVRIDGLINGVLKSGIYNPHGGVGNCVSTAHVANCGHNGAFTKSGQWEFLGAFSSNAKDGTHASEERGGLVLAFADESGSTPHNVRVKCEFDYNRYCHIQARAAAGLVADGSRFVQQTNARPLIDVILGSNTGELVSSSTFRDCQFRHVGGANPNISFFSIGANQVDILNPAWVHDPTTTNTTKYDGNLSLISILDASTKAYGPAANTLAWMTAGARRGSVNSDGTFFFGASQTPSASVAGTRIGDMAASGHIVSSGGATSFTPFLFVNANGTVGSITMTGSTTGFNTSSDRRLNRDFAPLVNGGEIIDALAPVIFRWRKGGDPGVGFVAQEVYAIAPEVVVPRR